jgi:hypothetical protein
MDRRKKLATAGAISLTASAAVIALGSSIGLFGLTDDNPRVGKLSPIDSTQSTTSTRPGVPTTVIDDTPTTIAGTPTTTPGRHDGADDPVGHDANDDRVNPTTPTTPNTAPEANDDHGGDDNRGPGSANSGSDDDNSGPGSSSSGSGHDEDD